jgi:hypothetical protein
VDISAMFSGHAHNKKYTMEKVPLRVGVLIRPDDNFYDKEAIDSYKHASEKLHNLHHAHDL